MSREGTSRLSGPSTRRYGIWTAKVFCLRHRVLTSGTNQCSRASRRKLATAPAVCRKGSLNGTLIERRNWMAASEKTGGRPRRPSCGASHVISWSTQPLGTMLAAMPCRSVDQHRAALAQRRVIAGPVRRAVAGGRRLAPCDPSNHMDPRCESSEVRVLQQRPSIKASRGRFCGAGRRGARRRRLVAHPLSCDGTRIRVSAR